MLAKTDAFEPRLAALAELGKALAHPARIAILELLAEKESCICGEVVEELPLAQASVSRHLKALKEAGLIKGAIDGPRSCYCLDREALADLQEQLSGLFDGLLQAPPCDDCC